MREGGAHECFEFLSLLCCLSLLSHQPDRTRVQIHRKLNTLHTYTRMHVCMATLVLCLVAFMCDLFVGYALTLAIKMLRMS